MNNQTLHSLTAKNFKNLSLEAGLELKDLNIFIGPNGSGKSNFVSLLKFLRDCVAPGPESGQRGSPFESAVTQLGGSNLLDRAVKPPADVQFSYHFYPTDTQPRGLNLDLELFVGAKDSKVSIGAEALLSVSRIEQQTPFYFYKYHNRRVGEGVISHYDDDSQGRSHYENVAGVPNNSLGLVLTHQFLEDSKIPPERTPIYKVGRELIENISRWYFYNANYMNLYEIRNSEPKIGPGDVYLSTSGHNLALVIDNLSRQNIDFEEALNRGMRSILPITRRVRSVRTGLMSLNLEWHYEGLNDPFYLNEMSDGTVRMLCWATILLSPKLPTLLVSTWT